MSNGKCEEEKGVVGTSSDGSAKAPYPMYESGLYRNDGGYVKKLLLTYPNMPNIWDVCQIIGH